MEQWTIILLAAVAVVVAVVVTALVVREKDRKKVAYMLDAFEDGELNFRFTENSAFMICQDMWADIRDILSSEVMRRNGDDS